MHSLSNVLSAANVLEHDAGCGVTEWLFPGHISQSTLDGRNGSNACFFFFFIALNFGQIHKQSEPFNIQEEQLNSEWQEAIKEAIIMRNDMHDVLYDQQRVNVTPEEAVDAVGNICEVRVIVQ